MDNECFKMKCMSGTHQRDLVEKEENIYSFSVSDDLFQGIQLN